MTLIILWLQFRTILPLIKKKKKYFLSKNNNKIFLLTLKIKKLQKLKLLLVL